MKWFNNPQSIEELKRQYHKLAIQHHPDKGGSLKDMQEINAEYDSLFAGLKNTHETAEGKTYTSNTEATETPEEFRTIINAIIKLDGIQIEICGSWLWITGNTYNHRDILKELHFRFSKSKCAWYYHSEPYNKRGRKTFTLDEIRSLHGSQIISGKPDLRLEIV